MSSIKAALAMFEQTIEKNELSGSSTSRLFLCNIAKSVATQEYVRSYTRGIKAAQDDPSIAEMTDTSASMDVSDCLDNDQSLDEMIDDAVSHAMIEEVDNVAVTPKEVIVETIYEQGEVVKEVSGKVGKEPSKTANSFDVFDDNERMLFLTWEEQAQRRATLYRKPVQSTGSTMSLKDRMRLFAQ